MPDVRDKLGGALGATYTIEQELGGGGMSRVFLARDSVLGRTVAVKVLSPELAATVSVDRFRREIMLSANLQHPHIVPVLGSGELDGLPYFTMPYVEGESLRARIRRGPMQVANAVSILRDVARALSFAHERGIVHRDIKPDNVLIAGGSAMVADFGVAKAVSESARDRMRNGSDSLTGIGTSLGTPQYMAPEQAAGDPETDHRADIYALGVMAYEMLAGAPPFGGRSPQQVLAAHITERPAALSTLRPGLPSALETLVMRCLEKDPSLRPQTAADVVEALDDPAVVSGAFSSSASGTHAPVAVRPARRGLTTALAALALAGAAVIGAMIDREPAESALTPQAVHPGSVAVLPLVGLDSADAALANTMTEEITSALGRLEGVQVASRTAAASALRVAVGPQDIAGRLRVATVVEGTVQREGNRVRVTARLVNAGDGFMLWADVYEADARNVFAMQDSIARAIGRALGERLGV
jgi:eukaryotic-like serine/threonine-protein kinase